MNCHVCARPIDAALVAVEVLELESPRIAVWGPVPAHEGCEQAVVTPFDDRLRSGYERVVRRVDERPAGGLGLHATR